MMSLEVSDEDRLKCAGRCVWEELISKISTAHFELPEGYSGGNIKALVEQQIKERVLAAVKERDDMWIMHEREQINFLKEANFKMLCGLHSEIEKLHHELRDTNMKLYVDQSPTTTHDLLSENEKLRHRLCESEKSNQQLALKLEESAKNAYLAEQQLIRALEIFKNQLAYQSNKIRELTDALRERTENITELVSQARAGSCRLAEQSGYKGGDRIISKPSVHLMRVSSIPSDRPHSEKPVKPGLVRSISVSYPGGRPNVVLQKYCYNGSSPRSRHLPPLFSTGQCGTSNGGCSSERLSNSSGSPNNERSILTQLIGEGK